jgi:intracellular sulfur oxidation DsrE/DsrF family protein
MKSILSLLAITSLTLSLCKAQASGSGNSEKAMKDSLAHAKMIQDSLRIEKLFAGAQFPYIRGSKLSGVIPVADPTEVPDPKRDYKLLFEVSEKNPGSLAKEINKSLDEVARVLNLHVASGIPPSKIIPVIVVRGSGLEALMKNESYQKKHSLDNPNMKLIQDLEKAGAKFIACGQAMAFHDMRKADLLPETKISLTAQTVLSNYQLQGFVLYSIKSD